MRNIIAITLLAGTCWFLSSLAWAGQQDLPVSGWLTSNPHNFRSDPPSREAILSFVKKLTGTDDRYLSLCSARFADLRNSKNLSLIVSTASGRFCDVQIIDKTSSDFELYDADSSRDSSIEVKDIDGNGTLELIADIDLTSYAGANHCQAEWPVIYAWTGNGYSDVSSQYKEYFRQRLASLKEQIAALSRSAREAQASENSEQPGAEPTPVYSVKAGQVGLSADLPAQETGDASSSAATPTPLPNFANLDCLKAEAAKIERFLGISRDAGMDDAIKWANSADPWTRVFASEILAGIPTPDARLYLRSLSRDPNRMVAGEAKDDLESGQAEQHTVDQVQFGGPTSN